MELEDSNHRVWIGGLYAGAPLKLFDKNGKTWESLLQRSEFKIVKDPEFATICLFIDIEQRQIDDLYSEKDSSKWILIRNEPQIVWPPNYHPKNVSKFDLIIDIGRDPTIFSSSINWPQYFPEVQEVIHNERSLTRAVMICGNHLRISKGELYSLRRKCAHKINSVDLFGTDWQMGLFRRILMALFYIGSNYRYEQKFSLKGLRYWFKKYPKLVLSPKTKSAVLIDYRVSLVIENCEDFLTEKLFDSFFAGCVPVYVGPNINNFDIPSNLVIQCEPNVHSIETGIRNALAINYEKWVFNVAEWVNNSEVRLKWQAETMYEKIIENILLYLNEPRR